MRLHILAAHGNLTRVIARLCILRHPHVCPYRLRGVAAYGQCLVDVEHVGYHRRVPVGRIAIAASATVLVEFVGHDVAHEIGAEYRRGYDGIARAQVADRYLHVVEVDIGP